MGGDGGTVLKIKSCYSIIYNDLINSETEFILSYYDVNNLDIEMILAKTVYSYVVTT